MRVLDRIINSKKFALTTIPVVINLISSAGGWALPLDPIMLVVDSFFGGLLGIQGLLDYKWGSRSDGTLLRARK